VSYAIHKQTYAGGQAYRYHVSDEAGRLRYVAEPTGLLLPFPTRQVEFFDPDHSLVGRIRPPDVAPWQRGERYDVMVGKDAKEPRAVIRERWRQVDVLLLHLPHYEVQLGKYSYVVRGSRYGERFYEIFRPRGEEGIGKAEDGEQADEEIGEGEKDPGLPSKDVEVGYIQRPAAGPSYIVETDAAPLRQSPLALAALVILIDMELDMELYS
jgi:hypothetical protein